MTIPDWFKNVPAFSKDPECVKCGGPMSPKLHVPIMGYSSNEVENRSERICCQIALKGCEVDPVTTVQRKHGVEVAGAVLGNKLWVPARIKAVNVAVSEQGLRPQRVEIVAAPGAVDLVHQAVQGGPMSAHTRISMPNDPCTHTNHFAPCQTVEVAYCGRLYRVTGSPDVAADNYRMVEVFRAETAGRRATWAALSHQHHPLIRKEVEARAIAKAKEIK